MFYALSGKDALLNGRKGEEGKNSIPDFIDSVGKRLIIADKLFSREVGLISPLENKMYADKAEHIHKTYAASSFVMK